MLKNIARKNPNYAQRIQERILEALREHPLHFCDLIKECEGAFPVEVARQLGYLVRSGEIRKRGKEFRLPAHTVQRASRGPSHLAATQISQDPLPRAHPLDFDWRFTPETQQRVVALVALYASRNAVIGLLGVPSVFLKLRAVRPNTTLIDRNRHVVKALSHGQDKTHIHLHDLFCPLQPRAHRLGTFDFVLADPPWYLEYYKAFSVRAAEMLRIGGTLALSLLPTLTRPSAVEDRNRVLTLLAGLGFELGGTKERFLSYRVPTFERVALEQSGIACPGTWRSSDLWLFTKTKEARTLPTTTKPKDDHTWESFAIGDHQVRLRIRNLEVRHKTLRVEPISKVGGVFRSVSRRSRRRSLIDLWTSDNRAYAIERTDVIAFALEKLQTNANVEQVLVATTRHFDLKRTEITHLKRLVEDLVRHAKRSDKTK